MDGKWDERLVDSRSENALPWGPKNNVGEAVREVYAGQAEGMSMVRGSERNRNLTKV